MNRREFFKLGAAFGAGAVLSARGAAGPLTPQGEMSLPEHPGFRTKHLVTIILGAGARKMDVVESEENAPFQYGMAKEGTLFVEDYGETASLHGYMVSELLTGRDAQAQRPLYPTWNEYVRKKTGGRATDFWMLQGASYYRGFTWDVKNFSRHRDYGIRYGATSLTMNDVFRRVDRRSPREILDASIEAGLGHSPGERRRLEEWLADVLKTRAYEFPSTREPAIERKAQIGDCRALHLAGKILSDFRPQMVTVQVLALDDAHAEPLGLSRHPTGYGEYIRHVRTTDELIGNLWAEIQRDPYLRDATSLIIRPDGGRDTEVDERGQLGHSSGSYHAHHVWTSALGPDFPKGKVITERVQRRDLAPTVTYLMSGESAEYATGHVRTQLFADEHRMPRYVLPPTAAMKEPVIDWDAVVEERRSGLRALTVGQVRSASQELRAT